MEIDVTRLVEEIDCGQLSGSVAELGSNAGNITWSNCMELAKEMPVVDQEHADEIRDYFREYGAWDREEIDTWTLQELSAMCLQEAAANIREFESCDSWDEYQKDAEAGRFSGQLYRDDSGKVFCAFYR
jgi:hypothetical protein